MEDLKLEEIRLLLGNKSQQFSNEELRDTIVKMKYLVELWLDSFEKEIFEGKTLQELLAGIVL